MNSLRDRQKKPETKLTEIRFSINYPQNKNKICILVEGESDIKLFRKIFSSEYSHIHSVEGKSNVVCILRKLYEEDYQKIIAIADADFDHLDQTDSIEDLFLTDYHDMEVQMIESPALKSIIDEYSTECCFVTLQQKLKNKIYAAGIIIGYTRWLNHKEKQQHDRHVFKFNGLNFEKFIEVKNCNISFNDNLFFETLLDNSDCKITIEQLKERIAELKNHSTDEQQICNGHDLSQLIAMIFSIKKNSYDTNINQKKVQNYLRLSYTIGYFKNTTLFNNLETWCRINDCKIFNTRHLEKSQWDGGLGEGT